MQFNETLIIGGIPTLRATKAELAQIMVDDCQSARRGELTLPHFVTSSNGMVISEFHTKPDFRDLILQAHIVDADGMPLVMASRLFCKHPLRERTATTDFIQEASAAAVAAGLRFYFLGGKPGVAEKAASALRKHYPDLQIVGIRNGYFPLSDEAAICEDIRLTRADVIWVGLGSPRQESFAVRNRSQLSGVAWIRTCGGLFDHLAGKTVRAPKWVQHLGFEWLFRAVQEPLRLGPRYISANPIAVYHLLTKTHD
jgi:N-acetylglucosaminyldiphosphoundecaprenol N-acetyl-beta-D-mannosaminyltransferase